MSDEEAKLAAVREFLADLHAESPSEFRRIVNFFLMQTGSEPLQENVNAPFHGGLQRTIPGTAMSATNGKP
jgi:hypothetical protein